MVAGLAAAEPLKKPWGRMAKCVYSKWEMARSPVRSTVRRDCDTTRAMRYKIMFGAVLTAGGQ